MAFVLPAAQRETSVRPTFCSLLFYPLFFGLLSSKANDTVIPAGRPIRCTLDAPSFSSSTRQRGWCRLLCWG